MRVLLTCVVLISALTLVHAGESAGESALPGQGLYERVLKFMDARLSEMDGLEAHFKAQYVNKVRNHHELGRFKTADDVLSVLTNEAEYMRKCRAELVEAMELLRAQRLTLQSFNTRAVQVAIISVNSRWKASIRDFALDVYKLEGESRFAEFQTLRTYEGECKELEKQIKNPAQLKAAVQQVEKRLTEAEVEAFSGYRARYNTLVQRFNGEREKLAGELLEFKDYLMKRKQYALTEVVSRAVLQNFAMGLQESHPKEGRNSELDYVLSDSATEDCDLVFKFYKGYPPLIPDPILRATRLDSLKREDSTPVKERAHANERLESLVGFFGERGLGWSLDALAEAPKRYAELRALIPAAALDVVKLKAAARDVIVLKGERAGVFNPVRVAQRNLAQAQFNRDRAAENLRIERAGHETPLRNLENEIADLNVSIQNERDEKILNHLKASREKRRQGVAWRKAEIAEREKTLAKAEEELNTKKDKFRTADADFDRVLNAKWTEFQRLYNRVRDALPRDQQANLTPFGGVSQATPQQIEARMEAFERRTAHLFPQGKALEALSRAHQEFNMAAADAKDKVTAEVTEYVEEALGLLDAEYARRSTPAARYPRAELADVRRQIQVRTEMLRARALDPQFETLAKTWDTRSVMQQLETVRAAIVLTKSFEDQLPILDQILRDFESGDSNRKVQAWTQLLQYHGRAHVEWDSALRYVRTINVEPAQRAVRESWATFTTAPLDAFRNPGERLYKVEVVESRHLYADETEKAAFMLTGLRMLNMVGPAPVR